MTYSSLPPRKKPLRNKTPLPPSGPIVRKTEMPRGEGFQASGNLSRKTDLPKQSKKRQRENRERRAMKNEMFPDGTPPCIVPWCGRWAEDLHEPLTRARGGSITEQDNAVPTCRRHNGELTEEPAWGYELNLLVHEWDRRTYAEVAADRRDAMDRWHAENSREAS